MNEQFYGLTDTGKQRDNNEDTFIAQPGAGGGFLIASVIDGVGGYDGGEVAAAMARETFIQRLDKPSGEVLPMLVDCFTLANERIFQGKGQPNGNERMACVATLVVADIQNNQFYFAHVGDTRLYLLRDGSLVKISHDQSFVGYLEESGRLTEAEAMAHPKRNEINKALGFEANLAKDGQYIETGQSPFLPGDTLLLCSDGLTDMVGKEEITSILNSPGTLKDKCRELVGAANHHGGADNITAVLVKNNKAPLQHEAITPPIATKKNLEPERRIVSEPEPVRHEVEKTVVVKKSNTGLIALLTIMMLAFLGISVWQYIKFQTGQPVVVMHQPDSTANAKAPNKDELAIQKAIDSLKGSTLVLADSAYHQPILLTQSLLIQKDSLHIIAKGNIEFRSDSGFAGPAFSLAQTCKKVTLDSLSMSGFKIGIIAFNNALQLKNVRFADCTVPVQNNFLPVAKRYTNGSVPATVFVSDSVPFKPKPLHHP